MCGILNQFVRGIGVLAVASGLALCTPRPPQTLAGPIAIVRSEQTLDEWKTKRAERTGAPDGWLTVVGLFWLKSGDQKIGGDPSNPIRLPNRLPGIVGEFRVATDGVFFRPAAGVSVNLRGTPFEGGVIASDANGDPDILEIGGVQFFVIARGDRLGVRIRDSESAARKAFRGFEYFPTDAAWRGVGHLEKYPSKKTVQIQTVMGTTDEMLVPGILHVTMPGRTLELEPFEETPGDDSELFIVFRDATSGRETYGAARFLYATKRPDGDYNVDFNRAYNPPCALTPFATCPLPPQANLFSFPIPVGEKNYTGPHAELLR